MYGKPRVVPTKDVEDRNPRRSADRPHLVLTLDVQNGVAGMAFGRKIPEPAPPKMLSDRHLELNRLHEAT
jgi:hypothetical protein